MADPIIAFANVPECEAWFAENHDSHSGFWLKIGKGGKAAETVSYAEGLRVALCHGWIDGQKKSLDDEFWLQRFTRRTARSKWSKVNRDSAEALIASGAMRPAGRQAIEAAKSDGRWDAAYDAQSKATVPDDLAAAFAADPVAEAFFATLNSVNRYAILYRTQDAKKPETRAARIEKFVGMCHRHETIHPQSS
jgi:uncharacterized protein YdeI (YjbR/CyaY-like superfamily)